MSWETTAVGTAAPVVALAVAYMGYRRSKQVDSVAAQSGVATESRAGTAQVIEGLNQLIDQLQDDNKSFRNDIKQCATRIEAVTVERDDLRRQLNRMLRLHGDPDKNGGPT